MEWVMIKKIIKKIKEKKFTVVLYTTGFILLISSFCYFSYSIPHADDEIESLSTELDIVGNWILTYHLYSTTTMLTQQHQSLIQELNSSSHNLDYINASLNLVLKSELTSLFLTYEGPEDIVNYSKIIDEMNNSQLMQEKTKYCNKTFAYIENLRIKKDDAINRKGNILHSAIFLHIIGLSITQLAVIVELVSKD